MSDEKQAGSAGNKTDVIEVVEQELSKTGTDQLVPHQDQTMMPVQSQADRLLEMAISKGTDMAQLEKLMDLKERHDKEEARKEFTAALSAFKSEDIAITKDKSVGYENKDGSFTGYKHASLGNIVEQAVPKMALHGLSHRWNTNQEAATIEVTCVLTHRGGHSESVSLKAAPDGSGKKNAIQQVASTISYLERYTFLAITGLAVRDQLDDDGVSAAEPVANEPAAKFETISEEQSNTIHAKLTDNGLDQGIFIDWLCSKFPYVKIIDDLSIDHYDRVIKKLDETIAKKQDG